MSRLHNRRTRVNLLLWQASKDGLTAKVVQAKYILAEIDRRIYLISKMD